MELRECPFCGSEPVCQDFGGWEVYCRNCGASGPTVFHGTTNETTLRADAILTWNRRASPTSVPEGYALVPVVPTHAILDAMFYAGIDRHDGDLTILYRAILAAAPTPPVSEDRKDAERYHKLANYMIGTRFDIDDALVAASSIDEISSILDAMQEDKP